MLMYDKEDGRLPPKAVNGSLPGISSVKSDYQLVFFNLISPVLIRLLFDQWIEAVSKGYRRDIEGNASVVVRRKSILYGKTLKFRMIILDELYSVCPLPGGCPLD